MNSKEIENNVKQIFEDFSREKFIYDLLLAYGTSKTSITRLKKGDFNLSKNAGEVLYKRKIFFKEGDSDSLLSEIESLAEDDRILKHSPRFAIVTDFESLVAKDLKLHTNLDIELTELPKYLTFIAAHGEGGVEAIYADENIWLTQKMMGTLYKVDVRTVNYHLKKYLVTVSWKKVQ